MFDKQDLERFMKDLQVLTSIDSPSGHLAGIIRIIDFFITKFANTALIPTLHEVEENAPCLVLSNAQEDENIDLLLLAHIDTVYPVGTATKHPLKINNCQGFAPGVIDDKAGALLGLYALQKVDLSAIKVAFLLNSNEEVGSLGNSKIIQDLSAKSTYCLSLEAAREDGSLVDKRFGLINYKLHFSGTSATLNNFHEGSSALLEASKFIIFVHSLHYKDKDAIINATIIDNHNYNASTVPDKLSINVYIRFIDNNFLDFISSHIYEYTQSKIANNIKVSVEKTHSSPAMAQAIKQHSLKRIIKMATNKLGLADPTWAYSFGGSDACFASLSNTCAVIDGMGPVGGKFHSEDEYLDITSIETRCNILINTIDSIASSKRFSLQQSNYLAKKQINITEGKVDE